MLKALVRVDASTAIGSGHLFRCTALADALRARGGQVTFACSLLPRESERLVRDHGHEVVQLGSCEPGSEDDATRTAAAMDRLRAGSRTVVDWLIVDHYRIAVPWEIRMRPHATRMMVVDDLANRPHDCEVLLDQNYHDDAQSRYDGLIPPRSFRALGPSYALLRIEFLEAGQFVREKVSDVGRILVSFGGADQGNETSKAVEALSATGLATVQVDVAIGSLNPHRRDLWNRFAGRENVRLLDGVGNMADLMKVADLSVGAGGSTHWERCVTKLPSVVIATAENQLRTCEALQRAGAIVYLGWHENVGPDHIGAAVRRLVYDAAARDELSRRAYELMGLNRRNKTELRILPILLAPSAEGAA